VAGDEGGVVFEDLIRDWSGRAVVVRHEPDSKTWMFIALHARRGGASGGGTRLKVYPTPADGLRDAMRLAEAMSLKMAIAGAPFGGGKAVLAVPEIPRGEARRRLLHAYGDLVDSLGGSFLTAPDVNTDDRDMDIVAERTRHAFGRTEAAGGSGSTAPDTAVGVFHGIRAAVGHAFGSDDLRGRKVVVQGAGGVGGNLVAMLAAAGASVAVADVDAERAAAVGRSTGAEVLDPDTVLQAPCDVLAPCALGGILDAQSIGRLACRIVAGAANNQLASDEDGDRLREAGILYAPDFVLNAGGVLHVVALEMQKWSRPQLDAALEGIGSTLVEIFRLAEAEGTSTNSAATRLAKRRLEGAAAASDVAGSAAAGGASAGADVPAG
jgi:leucine dehydrogenase